MLNFRRKNIVAQNQIDKLVKAKADLECTVTERDQQLNTVRAKLHMKTINTEDQANEEDGSFRTNVINNKNATSIEKSLKNEVTEMIMINARDPDRPRFTLKELQKVLMEKNQLTVRLDQTQDELEQLKRG